ncbi:MAG TPA: hypothetical protein HPP81_00810 [Deltaproteobacteria bacterium]|jgi:hypothetical protein|nr:hypothetical protein [Deltaproteobacteria bacterium]
MPEPILMENFQKGHKGRRYEDRMARRLAKAHPDGWIVEALFQEIEELTENCPIITYAHVQKLRRALREQPKSVLAFMREKIVPCINALPETDRTIVGAESPKLGGEICLNCLTRRESDQVGEGDFLTREDAGEYKFNCARCGKPL